MVKKLVPVSALSFIAQRPSMINQAREVFCQRYPASLIWTDPLF